MKVEINGTPEEVRKFLGKKDVSVEEVSMESIQKNFTVNRLLDFERWSESKQDWVIVESMETSHMINALRKLMNSKKSSSLLESEEFKSLVLNLSDRIISEL